MVNYSEPDGVRLKNVENTVEVLEQTIANLVVGFAEHTVMIEAILGHLTFATKEEQDAFTKTIAEGRAAMFKIMQEQAGVMAETDPGTSDALERVVEEKQSSTTSE